MAATGQPAATNELRVPSDASQGDRIRLARIAAELEPDDLARALEMSTRTLARIEAGRRKTRLGELVVIARITGQDLSFFGASFEDEAPSLPLLPGAVKEDRE